MRDVYVLWLDDEWSTPAAIPKELSQARAAVEYELAQAGLVPHVICRHGTDIANDLMQQRVDLLIFDYELANRSNAFDLLERLDQAFRTVPPVFVFSQYAKHELEAAASSSATRRIRAVFFKDELGANDLARGVVQLFISTPLSFVVMSDLHVGYLGETGGISQERFLGSLYDSLESLAKEQSIDGLIACGDFAWRTQQPELTASFALIQHVAQRLGLRSHDQVFLTPGNHDLDFASGKPSWDSFGNFVKLLATTDVGYIERFEHRSSSIGGRQPFHDSASLFSVVHNDKLGIVVVGLNSNRPTGDGYCVEPAIDEAQWHALTLALQRYPKELLRIALLHHPIFSAPGGVYQDERSLADQGKALQMLAGAGVGLVFHGHAHFSAVHAHRIAVVNGPEALDAQGRDVRVADLLTIACPSLVAEPSSSAPQRQYLIVHLDRAEPRTGRRAFSLQSRVFNPADCKWSRGDALAPNHFSVGAS